MMNVTPIFGVVAAGAVALGGYKVLSADDRAPIEAQLIAEAIDAPIEAVTEMSDRQVVVTQSATDLTPLAEQAIAATDQPILARADPNAGVLAMSGEISVRADVSQNISEVPKVGFPPLFVMGLLIGCVADKYTDITGDEA